MEHFCVLDWNGPPPVPRTSTATHSHRVVCVPVHVPAHVQAEKERKRREKEREKERAQRQQEQEEKERMREEVWKEKGVQRACAMQIPALTRTAKYRAEWEQRVARSNDQQSERERGGRSSRGGGDRYGYEGRGRGHVDVDDRYYGGGYVEDDRYDGGGYREEEDRYDGRVGYDGRGEKERPSSRRSQHHVSGRLAGRLEMPEGVYFRDEDAPDRWVLCAVLLVCEGCGARCGSDRLVVVPMSAEDSKKIGMTRCRWPASLRVASSEKTRKVVLGCWTFALKVKWQPKL
eukprot:1149321-Pelagomonas_calceolata.AAC.3